MATADVTLKSLSELVDLSGRIAVITGAAKGLGKAIAKRLAEAGADLALGDIDEMGVRQTADELSATFGRRIVFTRTNVAESASVTALADLAVKELAGIDIWVNNAGIFPLTPALEMSDEDWDRVIAINLRGTFLGCREAARRMVARGKPGVIVNIASTAGFKGAGPGIPHYVASKHGVRGITRQMALELAPQQIRVLAVAPTTIRTEGVEAVMPSAAANDFDLDRTVNSLLGRMGVPDDVARVVLFCASDLSLFMTGSTLPVDAGELTR